MNINHTSKHGFEDIQNNFQLYTKYYNLLYTDKDYNEEVKYVIKQLKKYSNGIKKILEYGSGTGGHGLLLQKNGFNVYGLERSKMMVSIAKNCGLSCCVADICNFNLNERYDSVIALFHVVSYLTSNDDLIAAFQNAHRHLKKGGVFLFDVWYSPAVYEQKALPRVKKMQNDELMITRIANPIVDVINNKIDIQYTVISKDFQTGEFLEFVENHPMRHFSIPEIDMLARYTGFEMLHAEEFLSGNKPSEKTWGVCFIIPIYAIEI